MQLLQSQWSCWSWLQDTYNIVEIMIINLRKGMHINYIKFIYIMFNMIGISDFSDFISQQVIIFRESNQNQNLYSLDVQASQYQEYHQNQEGVSNKCLEYIAKIQYNLQGKYQNIDNLQVNQNQIGIRRKKIKKFKTYQDINLNKKIKQHKRQLNSLWALRLFNFLKGKSKKHSAFRKINHLKNQMVSTCNIQQLSKVFKENPWVGEVIHKQKQNFLDFINKQKINDQTKLILFQTFDILLEGIKHPESMVSWNLQINVNTKESKQLLRKFEDKSSQEIHQLAAAQYQRQKQHYQSNKCSPYNNISYFWFKYIKDIFQSQEFKSLYQNHQIYKSLSFIFSQSATIANIRDALSIKQLAQYILNTKIESKQILSQLIMNSKINLLNKINGNNLKSIYECSQRSIKIINMDQLIIY